MTNQDPLDAFLDECTAYYMAWGVRSFSLKIIKTLAFLGTAAFIVSFGLGGLWLLGARFVAGSLILMALYFSLHYALESGGLAARKAALIKKRDSLGPLGEGLKGLFRD